MSVFNYCKFRDGVECGTFGIKCKTCGWNPDIEAKRIADIKSGKKKPYLKINSKKMKTTFRQMYGEKEKGER